MIKNIFLLSNKNYNMKSLFTMLRQKIGARKQLLCFLAFFIGCGLLLASGVSAQSLDAQTIAEESGLPTVSLATFIGRLLQVFFGLLGVVALALLMYGGFIWMTAAGDPNKVDKAKKIIQNAIVGLVIIFSAFAITTFLMGIFGRYFGGGTGGGGDALGGPNDWGRSGIGAGPIESVYPRPNQVDVPINTRIAVTFKQAIRPNSICETVDATSGNCANGSLAKNIQICETSATNTNCLVGSPFNVSSTVTQTEDGRTFVFIPQGYLGNNDSQVRVFKVTVDGDVKASSTGDSIFKGYRVNYYAWQFKTNGELDLNPPEIAKFEIYPYPDVESDIYSVGSDATAGSQTITINNSALQTEDLPKLNGQDITSNFEKQLTNPASVPSAMRVVVKSASGFDVINSGSISFTVDGGVTYARFSESAVSAFRISFSNTGVCSGKDRCLPILDKKFIETGAGFSIEASSDFIQGSNWPFSVTASSEGHELSLFDKDASLVNLIFVSSTDNRTTISKTVVSADGRSRVSKNYLTVKKGVSEAETVANLVASLETNTGGRIEATSSAAIITVTARNAGFNELKIVSPSSSLTISGASLSGNAKVIGWTTKPDNTRLKDPFNNSIFRVTFTEAINPVNVSNYIKVFASTTELQASTTITNQYRTIELKGVTPCGTNACGDPIFCWVNPSTSSPESVPVKVVVGAASLMTCAGGDQDFAGNEWCKTFGGTCSASGRCANSNNLFFSQAASSLDGISDMSNNSFNGNFNKALNADDKFVGNAEGKTGVGLGRSGLSNAYNLNSTLDDNYRPAYLPNNGTGDDFQWSFYLSNQVDNQSPLIKEIHPVGDEVYGWQQGQSFSEPVEIIFDRLMSFTSLRPGWGYSNSTSDEAWFRRFLVLKTITAKANPVGYWVNSFDVDKDGDYLADFTRALVNHNPFDQSVTYGPLVGSGVLSITQNCFLPAGAPQRAADPNNQAIGVTANECRYDNSGSATLNCTTDSSSTPEEWIKLPQPASYGYMNCADIEGTDDSCAPAESCMVPYYNASVTSTHKFGSWIVTKDKKADGTGRTGCCFGKCVNLAP